MATLSPYVKVTSGLDIGLLLMFNTSVWPTTPRWWLLLGRGAVTPSCSLIARIARCVFTLNSEMATSDSAGQDNPPSTV